MRLPPTALAVGIALLLAGCGSSSPAGPGTPPPPPPPPPPSGNTVRLTVVIPPRIDGRINTSMHRVLIISGSSGITSGGAAGAPLNRAGVTLKGFQCDRVANGPATCEVDIPRNQMVALVAEEGRSFHSGRGTTGGMPPDDWPAEFVDWGGDFAPGDVVEPGFLRFAADRDRRIEGRFQTIFPITVHVDAQATETIRFKVTASAPTILSVPASTYGEAGQQTGAYGGNIASPVEWFFLKTGSTLQLEVIDDLDTGCIPSVALGCSQFLNWTGDCAGGGGCDLTPQRRIQDVTAVTAQNFGLRAD